MYNTTVTVLGGLEIEVRFWVCPAEPDVGIDRPYIEEWEITHIAGRALKPNENRNWLYNRIEKAKQDNAVIEACFKSIGG